MYNKNEFRNHLLQGKPIWLQASKGDCSRHQLVKILNSVGLNKNEYQFFTPDNLMLYMNLNLFSLLNSQVRVAVVTHLDGLEIQKRGKFFKSVLQDRSFCLRLGVGLVLVSNQGPRIAMPDEGLNLTNFYRNPHEYTSIDDLIHHWIEYFSVRHGKRILSLKPEIADLFESEFRKNGEIAARNLIEMVVRGAHGSCLSSIPPAVFSEIGEQMRV